MPAERPILMSGPLVRAVLDGKKSQTRRPIAWPVLGRPDDGKRRVFAPDRVEVERADLLRACPHGQVGDRLWVRETFALAHPDYHTESEGLRLGKPIGPQGRWCHYRATDDVDVPPEERSPWRPSIHMPRWASRLSLVITDVRVERLQDISEEDARAEGVDPHPLRMDMDTGLPMERETARSAFARAWSGIYGADAWDRNDYVWYISFERKAAQP